MTQPDAQADSPGDDAAFDPSKPEHQRRRLSFGQHASQYDEYRPSYPMSAIEWALGSVPLDVVEVGAGTGLMTRQLLTAGHQVTAVEPDPGMRAVLQQITDPRLRVVSGSAESLGLGDGVADALIAAQAFHWFDLSLAVSEIARVLRPHGTLAIVWNIRDDDVPWVAAMSQIVGRLDARSGNRDSELPRISSHFADIEEATFANQQPMTVQSLVALVETFSYVAMSDDRDLIVQQVRDLATTHSQLIGSETFPLPYDTRTYRARKRT